MDRRTYSPYTLELLTDKKQLLTEYINLWEGYPKQGSEEWKIIKQDYIGGSEMSSLQNINIFCSLIDLIIKKSIGEGFSGSIKTRWGNIFEIITTKYVEYDKSTNVLGDDIFIIGNIEYQAYSPDGLGIIIYTDIEETSTIESSSTIDYVQYDIPRIVLFEFKSPYNRIPNGKIPKYYLPQIKSGLDTIEISEIGLFAEAVFRRCYWKDLGNNRKFLTNFGQSDPGGPILPLSYGFMIFYISQNDINTTDENYDCSLINDYSLINDLKKSIETELGDDFCDFAEASENLLNQLFTLVVDKKIVSIYHSDLMFGDNNYCDEQFWMIRDKLDKQDGTLLLGVLPWKLINIYYNTVDKEVGYLDKYKDDISDTMKKIKYYRENPNEICELYKNQYTHFEDDF